MTKNLIDEIIGWYGMAAILAAYALANFNMVPVNSSIYQVLNLTGAGGVAYISFKKKAYQPGVLNFIWAIIAIIALVRLL